MNPLDPNNPNNLDPKLRETYERIMGGSPQNTPQAQGQTPPQQAPAEMQQAPIMQTQEVNQPQTPPNITLPPPLSQEDFTESPLSSKTFVNPNPSASEVVEGDSPVKSKKKANLMPYFLTIGIILFFVVYAVIWSKVFGLF